MRRIACAALFLTAACSGPNGGVHDQDPGSPPPPVAYEGDIVRLGAGNPGYQRPRLEDEDCLPGALRRATGAAGVDNKVRFAVLRDGSLARFSYLAPVTPEQARSIEAAFTSCRWIPGLDPKGQPVAVWVIQPIKVVGSSSP